MSNKANKTALYLRTFKNNSIVDITNELKNKLKNINNVDDTKLSLTEKIFRIQHHKIKTSEDFILLHIVSGVEGETALTMNMQCTEKSDDGLIHSPKDNHEYIKNEVFLLLKDCHVILCLHGHLSKKSIANYLNKLLDTNFDFIDILNLNILNMIKNHGVKTVDFNASISMITAQKYKEKSENKSLISLFKKLCNAFLTDNVDSEVRKTSGDVYFNCSINLKRPKCAKKQSQDIIFNEALKIIENDDLSDDNITIKTNDNHVIKGSDVKLNKKIYVNKLETSNSLQYLDVWEKLEEYYLELKQDNLLQS